MTKLILIRGLPGSGKSTMAKLYTDDYIHLEADMYFIQDDGSYGFNQALLSNAHSWCQETTKILLQNGRNVVVSNTFTTLKEMQFYLGLKVDNLFVFRMTTHYGSIHNVPNEVIGRMKARFEDYPGEISIND